MRSLVLKVDKGESAVGFVPQLSWSKKGIAPVVFFSRRIARMTSVLSSGADILRVVCTVPIVEG